MFRAGDMVFHEPSQEDWLLAFGDLEDGTGKVAPAGWPACLAEAKDCILLTAATDEEHTKMLRQVANMSGSDFRGVRARGHLGSLPTKDSRQQKMDKLGITEQDIAETMPPEPGR